MLPETPTVDSCIDIKPQLIGTQIDDMNRLINQSITGQIVLKLKLLEAFFELQVKYKPRSLL